MTLDTLEDRLTRYRAIVSMRDRGMTYEEIGAAIAPRNGKPLSRQRINTILRNGPPRRVGRPNKEDL